MTSLEMILSNVHVAVHRDQLRLFKRSIFTEIVSGTLKLVF